MPNYRRIHQPGATWFFTVALAERRNNSLLTDHIDLLRAAFRHIRHRHPFAIPAMVVLPDHLHCIWFLPPDDADYATRWRLIKGYFSRNLEVREFRSESRIKRRERGVWQRRFWAHLITDQEDYNRHMDYIHWNPVKHGLVKRTEEWSYSSFHRCVRLGIYPADWGHDDGFNMDAGE